MNILPPEKLELFSQNYIPALEAAILGAAVATDLSLIGTVKIYHPTILRISPIY